MNRPIASHVWCVLIGLSGIAAAFGQEAKPSYPTWVDVTEKAGIHFLHSIGDDEMSNIVEATGSGCAFFDYDGDQDLDIYLVNECYLPGINHVRGRLLQGKLKNALYRNNGDGTFADVTEAAGVGDPGFGMACLSADYDNDGDADLFVTNYGRNILYRNNGNGTFTDVTKEAGLESGLWGIGCTFLDYDNDSFLDLYVGHYLQYDPNYKYYYAADAFPGPLAYPGQPDTLYHNRGDGTFEDVTQKAGVFNPEGRAMGVSSCDFDNDGDMDIFVANDAMENYMYQNNGDGTFTDIALTAGTAFSQNGEATSAMGPEFGDFNSDGWIDLLVPDMGYGCLYMNTGKGFFEEMSAQMGLASVLGQYTSWSGNFFDFDHDGFLDILIVNGDAHHLEAEDAVMFWNDQGQRFIDISDQCGPDFQQKYVSRGSAVGDYDNDGDQDALILNLNSRPCLLRNEGGNRNHWLMIHAVGTKSNRDAIGARVWVTSEGRTQMRDITSSSGYLSQSDYRVHFGLRRQEKVEEVKIRWPGGVTQVLKDVPANQVLTLTEPHNGPGGSQ
ncbi:MAG: CRTAC1 family protein [bacterium]